MSLSSTLLATSPPGAQAIFAHPTTRTILQIYQAGSLGATGLVGRVSSDLGQTWAAEFQISSRQDVLPSGTINFGTGDVHLVYSKPGDPALSSAWSVWYRVLVWNGSGWTITGEVTVEAGSGSQGLSNAVIDVDTNGYLAVAYYKKTASSAIMRTAASNAPFDLTVVTTSDAFSTTIGVSPIQPTIRFLTGIEWWGLVFELDGFMRIMKSATVLSPTVHSLVWGSAQTFFVTPTPVAPFDTAWNPDPDSSTNGQLGLLYAEGTSVKFRTWEAQTNIISATQTVNSAAAQSPALTRYFGQWIAGWMETVSGNQRKLRIAYTADIATKYDIDTDPGTASWQSLRFGNDISDYDSLALQWTEGVDPGLDGYTVYLASMAVAIFKNVVDSSAAVESLVNGPNVVDSITAVDEVPTAGEPKTVSDSAHASDAVNSIGRDVTDSIQGVESFDYEVQPGSGEVVSLTEILNLVVSVDIDDSFVSVDSAISGVPIPVSDSVSIAESFDMIKQIITPPVTTVVADDLRIIATETLLLNILVSDTGVASENIRGGPNVADVGSASESFAQDLKIADSGAGYESIGNLPLSINVSGQAVATRLRYGVVAQGGGSIETHSGLQFSWEKRGTGPSVNELSTRMFTFEDLDPQYEGIVFLCTPETRTSWRQMARSQDGGRTFNSVGPSQMACIAWGPDGTLWGTGNDGSTPTSLAPPDGQGGSGLLEWKSAMRQIFKSTDKGANWSKVYDDQLYGNGGRYPSYVHIAADPNNAGRILALGCARGSNLLDEIQTLSTINGTNWSVQMVPTSEMTNLPAYDVLFTDSMLLAVDRGRFIFFGTEADIIVAPDIVASTPQPSGGNWSTSVGIYTTSTYNGSYGGSGWGVWNPAYLPSGSASQTQILAGYRKDRVATTELIAIEKVSTAIYAVSRTGQLQKNSLQLAAPGTVTFASNVVAATFGANNAFAVDASTPAVIKTLRYSTGLVADSLTLNAGEGPGRDITMIGTDLYVAVGGASPSLIKIDASDPSNLIRLGSVSIPDGNPKGLTVSGTNIYLVTETSPAIIYRIDASGGLPTLESSASTGISGYTGVDAVLADGQLLYVLLANNSGGWISLKVDISGTITPGVYATSSEGNPRAIESYGSSAVVAYDLAGQGKFAKVSMGITPTIVSTLNTYQIYDLWESAGLVYASGFGASMATTLYYDKNGWLTGTGNIVQSGTSSTFDVTGSSAGIHVFKYTSIWATDNLVSWAIQSRYGGQAPFVDATYRGERIYAVRNDSALEASGARVVSSRDNGDSWDSIINPTTIDAPINSAALSAVAYDPRFKSLYVGTQDNEVTIWRMDDPDSGTWQDFTENLYFVSEDPTPNISFRGLGVLSVILATIDNAGQDTGHLAESLAIGINVIDGVTALDRQAIAGLASDVGHISEAFSITMSSSLTIRLLMHYGRIRLRLAGTNEPAVPSNPTG